MAIACHCSHNARDDCEYSSEALKPRQASFRTSVRIRSSQSSVVELLHKNTVALRTETLRQSGVSVKMRM